MNAPNPLADIALIFDADRNAYEAALSEGWPVACERAPARHQPNIEPFSAFLLRRSRQHLAPERTAA